jgi:aspartokinase
VFEAVREDPVWDAYESIYDKHIKVAIDANICTAGKERDAPELKPLMKLLDQLKKILEGVNQTGEVSCRLKARICSFGELMSTRIGVVVLQKKGLDATWIDARDLLTSDAELALTEEGKYLDAEVQPSRDLESVNAASEGHTVVVTQGFMARTSSSDRATCLLGRGGSDTAAALFAALCDAARLEIWTDVHGLFTSDPRQVPAARLLKRLNYREAFTMAAMGAKVLHQRCLRPAEWAKIPIEIRNTLDPEGPFTCICSEAVRSQAEELKEDVLTLGGAASGNQKVSTRTRTYSNEWFGNTTAGGGSSDCRVNSANNYQVNRRTSGSGEGGGAAAGDCSPSDAASSPRADDHWAMPVVLGIASCKSTLVTVSTRGEWGVAGYLARVLGKFGDISIDLIACSQYAVSVTVDHIPGGVDGDVFKKLLKRLDVDGVVRVKHPVGVVSIVGRRLNEVGILQ